MGYYGAFYFDVRIPASKVDAAERALAESERFSKEMEEEFGGQIDRLLDEYWHDVEVHFDNEPAPLEKLASAATDKNLRGGLNVEGHTHQKWRSYAEDMWDILAPFVDIGGSVSITGEEGEQIRWEFDGVDRIEDHAQMLWSEDLLPLENARDALVLMAEAIKAGLPVDLRAVIEKYRPDLLS